MAAALLALLLRRGASWIALAGALTGLAAALLTLWRVADGARYNTSLAGLPDWPLRLVVGPTGALLSAVVATVSAFVLVYAVGYMAEDEADTRFFAGMAFFTGAMQLLVLAGDWILLLAAWELIALASWLLIGFWYTQPGVGRSATWAFVVTRAADVGLYLGAVVLIAETGRTSIMASERVSGTAATVAGLAFLLAAIGKSAQAPLQGWLQDAMVGPTPVSALLHAATLVIAGVVLLVRAFPLLPSGVLLTIGIVGGVSAVVTGLTAVAQGDLKRLLASSTSSQLGLMLLAIGAGSVPAALVHLTAHAAMKSTLFLGAGVFQHDRESTAFDDLRGIGRQRPLVFAGIAVAGLALAGVPPLAGFWSKDAVIAATFHGDFAVILGPLAVAASLLTGVYIARALRLLWQGEPAPAGHEASAGGPVAWMGAGIAVLAALAAVLGIAVSPIGELLGAEVPESPASTIVGLLVAATGLIAGWLLPPRETFGRLWLDMLDGFRVRGGWVDIAVRPSLALAAWCDRLDRAIHAGVHALGRRGISTAGALRATDEDVHRGVLGVGHAGLLVARVANLLDVEGIDGLIAALVRGTRHSGGLARRLQSGLVHRELLIAAGGAVALLLIVLIV